jgi:hypothetical protein
MNKKIIITSILASNIYAQEECSIIKNDQKRLDCYDSYFVEKPSEKISKAIEKAQVDDNSKSTINKAYKQPNPMPEKKPTNKIEKPKKNYLLVKVKKIKISPTYKHTVYTENITFRFQEPVKSSTKIKSGDEIRIFEGLFGYQATIGKQNRKYAIKVL